MEGGPSHPSIPWPVVSVCVHAYTYTDVGAETAPEGVGEVLATPRSSGAQPHGCPSVCSTTDVHTVASLLKLYLRELPEPVVPFARYEDFLNCAQLLTKDEGEVSGSRGPMLGEWAC